MNLQRSTCNLQHVPMFTGIVEEAGVVQSIKPTAKSIALTVRVSRTAFALLGVERYPRGVGVDEAEGLAEALEGLDEEAAAGQLFGDNGAAHGGGGEEVVDVARIVDALDLPGHC